MNKAILFLLMMISSAAFAKTPNAATIHEQKWAITEMKPVPADDSNTKFDAHLMGHTNCSARVIYLRSDLSDAMKAETILHEFEHAVTCSEGQVHNTKWNNSEDNGEHFGILWSAHELHVFMVQNPQVMKFVMESGMPEMAPVIPVQTAHTPASTPVNGSL